MNTTRAGSLAAVFGGLVWLGAAILAGDGDVAGPALGVGLVGFLVAFAALGYSLVDHAPGWLRAVVSVATPALALTVWTAFSDAFAEDRLPVLVAGLLGLVVALPLLLRDRRRAQRSAADGRTRPVHGRRAAR